MAIGQYGQVAITAAWGVADARAWRQRAVAALLLALCVLLPAAMARAEDGHDLWLRYRALPAAQADAGRTLAAALAAPDASPTQIATREELLRGLGGLFGAAPAATARIDRDGVLVAGTPASSPVLAKLGLTCRRSATRATWSAACASTAMPRP